MPRGTPRPPGSRRPSRRSPRTCSGVGGEVPLQVVGDALGVLAALGWLAVEPGVVAGGRHLKDAAHGHDRERLLLVLRAAESEPHWLSLAKNAAALLGISHSISSVLLSRRRRCSSSCSDVVSTGVSPPSRASCAAFLTQPRIADSVKSKRLATSGTLSPPVWHSRTTSARSSSVNARRGAPLLRVRSHQDTPCALSRVAGCPPNGGKLILSATAAPSEYAERITALLKRHYNYGRDKMLVVARKTATPEQRQALADAPDRQARRRRGGTKP